MFQSNYLFEKEYIKKAILSMTMGFNLFTDKLWVFLSNLFGWNFLHESDNSDNNNNEEWSEIKVLSFICKTSNNVVFNLIPS